MKLSIHKSWMTLFSKMATAIFLILCVLQDTCYSASEGRIYFHPLEPGWDFVTSFRMLWKWHCVVSGYAQNGHAPSIWLVLSHGLSDPQVGNTHTALRTAPGIQLGASECWVIISEPALFLFWCWGLIPGSCTCWASLHPWVTSPTLVLSWDACPGNPATMMWRIQASPWFSGSEHI